MDPQKQDDQFSYFMKISMISTVLLVFLRTLFSIADKRIDQRVGKGIVRQTLERVLLAPINLFFDVTPIGKIINIFQNEINIFRQRLFLPLRDMGYMLVEFVMIVLAMMKLGVLETLVTVSVVIYLGYSVAKYRLYVDAIFGQ